MKNGLSGVRDFTDFIHLIACSVRSAMKWQFGSVGVLTLVMLS